MTPTIFFALAAVAVIGVGIGAVIGIRKHSAARDAREEALLRAAEVEAEVERVRRVESACVVNGHKYGPFEGAWRCATCGNYVARREGELYGPVEEGRIERRRQPR